MTLLRAELGLKRGQLALDVALDVEAGETIALVGPNGAGKTTILHLLAGILRVERGSISLASRVLDGGPGGAFVPPEGRGVGFVFQDHLLFPHMTVLENVAFGPVSRGIRRSDAQARALDWLERVGVAEHRSALPTSLSGGQAQRVALARALATEPRMLLLDEPLAAVDAAAKVHLRRELRAQLSAFDGVRLVVVHDIDDAIALADRLVVLEAGRVVQEGALAELVTQPRSAYVAELIGINCFRGEAQGGLVRIGASELRIAEPTEGPVIVTIHPRAVALFRERPAGSPRNVWRGTVGDVEPALDRMRVQIAGPLPLVAEVTPSAAAELGLHGRGQVWVAVKATEIRVSRV